MRIYQASTNGLWIGILVFIVLIFSVVALGGFLLGTPLGLAVLTLLIIRHYYKKHQRRKHQEQFEGAYGTQDFGWFGSAAQTDKQEQSTWQEDQENKVFSSEDKHNAIDVEFKEL